MTMGKKIAALRKGQNMTQEALARALGVSNQAVSKWEQEICCPDIVLLPQIADLFEITVDELFGREPMKQKNHLPWEDDGVLRAVVYVGQKLILGHEVGSRIDFCYEGPALRVESQFNVICDRVQGNVQAGGSVTCDDVQGDIRAGGSVTCDCAEGDIYAGGNITCDEANGNVHAGGNVYCDHADGASITAKGIVQIG